MKFFRENGACLRKLRFENDYYISKTGIIHCQNIQIENIKNKLQFEVKIAKEEIETIVYKFNIWSGLSDIDFILLRQIIIDSLEIATHLEIKNNVKRKFIKSLILFLQNFTHFDPLFSERQKDLTKLYFDLLNKEENLKSIPKEDQPKEQLFAAEQYLNLCLDDNNQDWFNLQKNETDQDREKQVENVAELLIKLKTKLKDKQLEKAEIFLQKARRWLLLRYDLDKAAKYQINNKPIRRMFLSIPELTAMITFLSLLFIKIDFWNSVSPPILHFLNVDISNIVLLFGYLILILLGVYLAITIKSGKNQFQIFLPRLSAGIVVGYFALMTDEAWNGVFSKFVSFTIHSGEFSWFIFVSKMLIPLFFVYIYLLIEMSNVKGINSIKLKAFRILFRGYSYSILIGIIFSDFFGNNLINRIAGNGVSPLFYFKGVFGNIYPEAVLLLSPLALFIGIFLQLLWEDKAITEKI